MRFKLDENLPDEAAELLRAVGHDAVTVGDQGMSGTDDSDVASVVRREHRALLTLDLDFSDIRTYPPSDYAGIVVLRLKRQDKVAVLQLVERLIPLLATGPLDARLWIVEQDRVRIRSAPTP